MYLSDSMAPHSFSTLAFDPKVHTATRKTGKKARKKSDMAGQMKTSYENIWKPYKKQHTNFTQTYTTCENM